MAAVFGEGSGAVAEQQEGGRGYVVRRARAWPFFCFV